MWLRARQSLFHPSTIRAALLSWRSSEKWSGKCKSTRQNTEKNMCSCQNSWFVSRADVARKEDACVLCSKSVQCCQMIFLQTHSETCETAFVEEQVLNCLENEKRDICVCEGVPICYSSTSPLNFQPSNRFGSRAQNLEVILRRNYKFFLTVLLLECFHADLSTLYKVFGGYQPFTTRDTSLCLIIKVLEWNQFPISHFV